MAAPELNNQQLNDLAKNLFEIDFDNNEFQFVMLSSLISLLLDKGVISEEEFEKSTSETGTAFKLFKHRNKLQENSENSVQNDQS
jgi:hypothetical protein